MQLIHIHTRNYIIKLTIKTNKPQLIQNTTFSWPPRFLSMFCRLNTIANNLAIECNLAILQFSNLLNTFLLNVATYNFFLAAALPLEVLGQNFYFYFYFQSTRKQIISWPPRFLSKFCRLSSQRACASLSRFDLDLPSSSQVFWVLFSYLMTFVILRLCFFSRRACASIDAAEQVPQT